ncbi:MAG TPA: hypothetical protein DEU95_15855 [Chloroflexi bacterium]|jgi:excisionase family DNA binding protein|nr:hypothetical protein [Chloroflexota bacterium]
MTTGRRTMTIAEAARALGISRSHAAECIRRDGHLAGVPAISVGRRRVLSRQAVLDVTAARREPVANSGRRVA